MTYLRGAVSRSRQPSLVALTILAVLVAGCTSGGGGTGGPTSPPAASPAATTPAASPTVAASSSPTAAAGGEQVVAAFMEVANDEDQTFHLDIDAEIAVARTRTLLEGEMDVAGDDYQLTMVLNVGGRSIEISNVKVGEDNWARLGRGEWQKTRAQAEAQNVNPFAELDEGDIEYVGTETRNGQQLHRLRLTKAVPLDPKTLGGGALTDVDIESTSFDVFVEEDGTPVTATFDLTGSGRANRQTVPIELEADYTFSGVGSDIVIEPPE